MEQVSTRIINIIRYSKNVDFVYIYFCEATDSMRYRLPNAYKEVSNINHSGSVDDYSI